MHFACEKDMNLVGGGSRKEYNGLFMSSPNSHVDILPPNVVVSGGGALGGAQVMRVEPS